MSTVTGDEQKWVLYVCPSCGRTVKWPDPSTGLPNTICACRYPEFVTQMVVAWPPRKTDDA